MPFCLKRVTGIEPVTTAWKAVVLPLNYTRIRANNGFWSAQQLIRMYLQLFLLKTINHISFHSLDYAATFFP